jgi:hypothetical protein
MSDRQQAKHPAATSRATSQNRLRCSAIRHDTQPCLAPALPDTTPPRCVFHSPQAQEGRRKGGRATRTAERAYKMLPSRLEPVMAGLEKAFAEIAGGAPAFKRANALATLARAMIACVQAGELEDRMRQLEELVRANEQQQQGTWGRQRQWTP